MGRREMREIARCGVVENVGGRSGRAFNIFRVNLTGPFLFIAELGVQVLSVRIRGRLIFNFISPSLHFIDGDGLPASSPLSRASSCS